VQERFRRSRSGSIPIPVESRWQGGVTMGTRGGARAGCGCLGISCVMIAGRVRVWMMNQLTGRGSGYDGPRQASWCECERPYVVRRWMGAIGNCGVSCDQIEERLASSKIVFAVRRDDPGREPRRPVEGALFANNV